MVALVNGQTRIIGGDEAAVGQHRYVSRLIACSPTTPNDCRTWCLGGSLIAPNAILTAAHCTTGDYPLQSAVVGAHSRDDADGIKAKVAQVIRHPQYDESTLSYDVAILLLDQNITTIEPVQVSFKYVPKNRETWVRGWGVTSIGGQGSNDLMELKVKTWSNVDAANAFASLTQYSFNAIDSSMLAAGGEEGKDSCEGDGGGPLTHEISGLPDQLVGITSWGDSCAKKGLPGVYSRISAFKDFIVSHCNSARNQCQKRCTFISCK